MKITLFHRIFAALPILLSIALARCIEYGEVPDCLLRAEFTVPNDTVVCTAGTACEIQFTDGSAAFTGLEYEWDFRDGSQIVMGVSSPKHSFAPNNSTPYRVLLTVRLGEGCMDTFSYPVWVLDGGPIAKFKTDKAMNMCFANELVTFTNDSENATSYVWNFGDGSAPLPVNNKNAVTHSYSTAGTYTVTLTATGNGRTNTTTGEVVVKVPIFAPPPFNLSNGTQQQKIVGIDQNAAGGYFVAVCDGKSVFFLTADEKGAISNLSPFANKPDNYAGLTVNKFRKLSSAYVLACEAVVASFAFKASALTFDFQRKRDLSTGLVDIFSDVTLTDKGDLLFCGLAQDQQKADSNGMYFVNANFSTLDKNWRKTFFTGQQGAQARCILNYESGYLVAGTALSGSLSQACFFRMGDDFKLVGTPRFWNAPNFKIDDIIPVAAGQYVLAGNDGTSGRVRLVDATGINLNGKDAILNGLKINQVIFTSNQRLVGAGLTSVNGQDRACWFEIDPATLELKGNIQPLPTPAGFMATEATCIAVTADGGFVLGGFARSGGNTSNLIFKTDTNGKIQ